MSKAGFVILPSYYDAIRPLSNEDRLRMYDALMDYKKMQEEPTAQRKDCPFQGGLYPRCTEDCSFYENGKCKPGTAQAGKRCPLPAHLTCSDSCMMYKDGRCTIFAAGRKKK